VAATASKTESQPETAAPEPAIRKDNSQEVEETVKAWAAAWSEQDVDKYLSYYADDFKTPGGETRAAWEATRRDRVGKPKYIEVEVRIMTIQFTDATHATVKFRQSYRASHLKVTSNKTLQMVKPGDRWLIQEEHS